MEVLFPCCQDRHPAFRASSTVDVVHISGGCAARFVAKRQSNFVEIETESVEMRSDCVAQAVGVWHARV